MPVSLAEFCAALTDLNLVSADEFRRIMAGQTSKEVFNVELLAKALIARKTLTKYQSQAILSGQAKRLTLGSYLLVDQLGHGGMGVVLKATHLRLKRTVAIKVLSPNVTKNEAALKRFHREVQAAARLEHPNIVAAFDADVARGVHFLVMQYVEGRDLATTVQEQGPLSVEQALQCLSQAACGLEYAHAQGIIHRDIKPANLLLEKTTGILKILDMGLARIEDTSGLGMDGETGLTNTGTIMGTIDFMSPEQAENTKKADYRSDIYGLGMTFYYLLTGQLAYPVGTMMEKLLAHREQPIPSLRKLREDVPESVDYHFQKMVAKQPGNRYQSMSEVLAATLACLAGAPTTAPGHSGTRVAVVPDSMDSEFRAFVNGLAKEGDTQENFVPGEPTRVNEAAQVTQQAAAPKSASSTGSSIVRKLNDGSWRGKIWSDPRWIAAGASVLVLLTLGLWMGTRGTPASSKKGKARVSEAADAERVKDPVPEEVPVAASTSGNPLKIVVNAGTAPEIAQLLPLPAGEPSGSISGLVPEPGKRTGLNAWQIDSVLPRSQISAVDWSPDNTRVVVGCYSGQLRIYDVATWKLLSYMTGHMGGVRGVSWNPEGSRIASCGNDNVVRLWQIDGTAGPVLKQCPSPACVAWSPGGEFLIAASSDRNKAFVQMWTADGKPRKLFTGHTDAVRAVAWSTDGRHFVSASEDKTLRVCDLKGNVVTELSDHARGLQHVAWSSTGAIATSDAAGTVYLYPDTAQSPHISLKVGPRCLQWNPAGTSLAIGLGSRIQLWDAGGQFVLKEESLPSQTLRWSPDGKVLAGAGQSLAVWNPEEKQIRAPTLVTRPERLAVHPDGNRLVVGCSQGTLLWWAVHGEATRAVSNDDGPITAAAWSPDGATIAAAHRRIIHLWSATGTAGVSFSNQFDVDHIAFSPDSQYLVVAGGQHAAQIWQVDGTRGALLKGHTQNITGVDWGRNDELATASRDSTVRMWKPDGTPGKVIEITPANNELHEVRFNQDGSLFAVNMGNRSDTRIQIWNADGSNGPTLKGNKWLSAFAWNPDGTSLAGGESSGEFRLWSREGFQGASHNGPGWNLAPKALVWGKQNRLLTTADDDALRCWDATSFRPMWIGLAFANNETVTVAANGTVLHSTGDLSHSIVWLVDRSGTRIEVLNQAAFDALKN